MDRSWMGEVRTSAEYKQGVEGFLSFAFRDVVDGGKIFCPCVNCANKRTHTYDEVKTHLRCDGILQGYTTWICHGEQYNSSAAAFGHMSHATNNMPISNNLPPSPRQGDYRRSDDMLGLLNAVQNMNNISHSDIPEIPLDEHLEYTDLSDSSPEEDNVAAEGQDEISNQDNFSSYSNDADSSLYDGCESYSELSFLVRLFHLKCLNGWTQQSFTLLLEVLSNQFPDTSLPKTFHEAKKIIRGLGLHYQKIHACPKDCMLFWGERSNQEFCHICKSSRWLDEGDDTSTESRKKKRPAKVLRYFPLIPRLRRLYASDKTSNDMRWHDEGRTKDEFLRHPADGQAWKDLDKREPSFASDSRNVRLGLASDGFNPFRNMNLKHSTWPVMLIPYNLPPWICMKETNLILSMIIPGPDSPGNDIDVYLQPLIEELSQLWEGVWTVDSTTNRKFKLKAALLWTLNDFPALAYLYGWSTRGTYACPSCAGSTKSFYLTKGKKMCYMGHRRWLPQGHSYRRQKKKFDGNKETGAAPKPLTGSSVLKMLEGRVFVLGKKGVAPKQGKNKKKGTSKNKEEVEQPEKKRKRASKSAGTSTKKEKRPEDWLKKKSIFFDLPYWEHNLLRHNLDVMHIEKNVCDNLIGTLLDIESKSKDDWNARLDLVELGIRSELQPDKDEQGETFLPWAPFNMSKEQKEILCSIIKKMKTPDGYASNLSRCVNMKDCTLSGLKSHDSHVLIEDILPIALRSCYPSKEVMTIVIDLADFFKKLCSKVISIPELDELQNKIVLTMCNMEKIFLPSFFTIMVHLMVHLVDEVKLGGPVHYRWMYPLERQVF